MRIDTSGINVQAPRAAARRHRRRGSAALEFALSSIAFMAFLFGIIDFCRAFYTYEFVNYAARLGTRYAIVRGSACAQSVPTSYINSQCGSSTGVSSAQIQTYVQQLGLPGINGALMTVTATWPATGTACPAVSPNSNHVPTNSPDCPVNVVVTYPYSSQIPFIRLATLTLKAHSQMVISQ
jgi:Flp pilus assembly protein TadG